jgi:LmbE family N-acetylglucosaminyl deacetylase
MHTPAAPPLVVLSPHPDDAAFSVSLTIRTALARALPVRVITVFSRSFFAPFGPDGDTDAVTALRRAEDDRWSRRLGPLLTRVDLELPDAALTLERAGDTDPIAPLELVGPDAVRRDVVASLLGPHVADASLVLAPLGLGRHLDHIIVRDAAITCVPAPHLMFYEDLPYAAELDEASLCAVVASEERPSGRDLYPFITDVSSDPADKYRDIMTYRSQIDSAGAWALVAFSGRYQRSERLWGVAAATPPIPCRRG